MTCDDYAVYKQCYIDTVKYKATRYGDFLHAWTSEELRRAHRVIVGTEEGWDRLEIPSRREWEAQYPNRLPPLVSDDTRLGRFR